MTDIKEYLNQLKQQLEQEFETETPERKIAREKVLKQIKEGMEEFNILSQKVGTTPDQMKIISQLQNVISRLGNIKGK